MLLDRSEPQPSLSRVLNKVHAEPLICRRRAGTVDMPKGITSTACSLCQPYCLKEVKGTACLPAWCPCMHATLRAPLVAAAGYFTSRPTSKGWIRSSTSFLQAARQLEILSFKGEALVSAIFPSSLGSSVLVPSSLAFVAVKEIRPAKTRSEGPEMASAVMVTMGEAQMQV